MKKIALLSAITLSLFAGYKSEAKVNINISFGIPVQQQSWFANDNDYFYMPDQGAYYNVNRQMYVFQDGGNWCTARRLPSRFGNVSYMNARTVRMRDRSPFMRDRENRQRFFSMNQEGFRSRDVHNAGRPMNDGRDFGRDNDRDFDRNDGRGFDQNDGRRNGSHNGYGNGGNRSNGQYR